MNCMRISGYTQKERYNTVKGAVQRYRQIRDMVTKGEKISIYRSGEEIRDKKSMSKCWSNTWFLKGNVCNTVSCPVTPGGVLKRNLTKVVNIGNNDRVTQVIEDGGKPIHSGLSISDPMRTDGCIFRDENCIVDTKYKCDTTGVVYRIECNTCNEAIPDCNETDRYIGMTRTSLHNRMDSHLRDQRYKKSSSPLHRHDSDKHEGNPQKYTCKIVGNERKLVRLGCLEAILIEKQPRELSINAKMEKGRGGVVRISAIRT